MSTNQPHPPEGGFRVPGPVPGSLTGLPIEQLVEVVADSTVRSGDDRFIHLLIAELERRSGEALWDAVEQCLGPLATCRMYELGERAGVDRMRHIARTTPDATTSLTLDVWAAHRENGTLAAREVWEQAGADVQQAAARQLVITMCWSIGSDSGRLTPAQTVALIRSTVSGPES